MFRKVSHLCLKSCKCGLYVLFVDKEWSCPKAKLLNDWAKVCWFTFLYKFWSSNWLCFDMQNWLYNIRFATCTRNFNQQGINFQFLIWLKNYWTVSYSFSCTSCHLSRKSYLNILNFCLVLYFDLQTQCHKHAESF